MAVSRGSRVAGIVWLIAVVLLAAVLIAESVAPDVSTELELGRAAWAVGLVAATTQAGVLARRRVSPELTVILVSAVAPIAAGAGLGAATGITSVAVFVAAYLVTIDRPWPAPVRSLVAAAVLVGLAELARQARDEGITASSAALALAQGFITVALPVVVGVVVAARRDAGRARDEQDKARAGERVARAQAAVASERTAMARELHDIAAHHLSGIAVMTAALDRQIDTDPEGAKAAVREVRQQSTAMLRDLRSLVSMLRDDSTGPVAAASSGPAPETLAGIPRLVDHARSTGRDVALTVLGPAPADLATLDVGPLAQLAAYRTIQESLTNAARHAPGASCEVEVDARSSDTIVLTVRNGPTLSPEPLAATDAGSGLGLVGMRERAELTDAHLTSEPTDDGGWLVVLAVPTLSAEDPTAPQEER